jgi:hypothetical protein
VSAVAAAPVSPSWLGREKAIRLLDRCFIYGSIILIPYDLPLIHQACVPLAALGVLLMLLRGDATPFVEFLRTLPLAALLTGLFCIAAVLSIFGNIVPILESLFQNQPGWARALSQGFLLLITLIYPFYFAFCLRRHGDWQALIIRAVWLSLPVPLLVGFLQIANLFHVPGLAHLPWVGGAYQDGSFWRLTSVARESSWFGSFACVILPFLVVATTQLSGWRKLGGYAAIGVVVLFVIMGTSKSAYVAVVTEGLISSVVYFLAWRPWRAVGKVALAMGLAVTALLVMAIFAPNAFDRVTAPFISKARAAYFIFEPLITGNTKAVSIGTRFGMSSAGIAMGTDHPVTGVGLGQFGFHAFNYTPLWGLNGETLVWLSNDTKAWPSTSNLYSRLIGEVGPAGCVLYGGLRLFILLVVALRLARQHNPTWTRDLCILATMTALVAFDFHRDSFVNLDIWTALGMAMACVSEERVATRRLTGAAFARARRIFLYTFPVVAALVLATILMTPVSHMASATLAPKGNGVTIGQGDASIGAAPQVAPGSDSGIRFQRLREFWGSATAAARIIAHRPDLARAVLAGQPVTPMSLALLISDKVTVLMADKQTTVTLQYRNPDPFLARAFLTEAIEQTDQALAAAARANGAQAAQLRLLTLSAAVDIGTRQTLLSRAAAQELQSGFDAAGIHAGFDYIEHPGIIPDSQSPQPLPSLVFALGLALMTAMVASMAALLLPVRHPA